MNSWKEIAEFGEKVSDTHVDAGTASEWRAAMESINTIMDNSDSGDIQSNVQLSQALGHLQSSAIQLKAASDLLHSKPVLKDYSEKVIKYINLIQEALTK